MNRSLRLAFLAVFALSLACGIKGAPRPPLEEVSQPPPPSTSPLQGPKEPTECTEPDGGCPQVQPPAPVAE